LAGVPQIEQFRTESVVRRGVASGDANLYLRNVLWLIRQNGKLEELISRMRTLFPKFHIQLKFDPRSDVVIDARISTTGPNGRICPVELVGTGVLQALQIFSYVTLFEPRLLLLDEPDSHLHPDNQVFLASALQFIASQTATQIIISTHSRHLVDALHEDANFVWLKDGKVFDQGIELPRLPLLLDIGALDSFDKLMAGAIEWVVLSEDLDLRLIRILAECSGFSPANTLFFSYKTSSNLEPAKLLAAFIKEISPLTQIVIHRDRDFLIDQEVEIVEKKITECGAFPFITERSDIESYFIRSNHIVAHVGVPRDEVLEWLRQIAQENHNALQLAFTRKRDEVKSLLYRENPKQCPPTIDLLGNSVPLPFKNCVGKLMLKKVRAKLYDRFEVDPGKLLVGTDALKSARLEEILAAADLA
jgi:energy-coupling factor transporter ATP-binding protein EcfA2